MVFMKTFAALVLALPIVNGLVAKRAVKCADGNTTNDAKCCALFAVRDNLLKDLFNNACGDTAHGALRLLFHDAIGIDPKAGGGGADGSIAVFNATELTFHANQGIDDVLNDVGPFLHKFSHVLSPGDFIQFAGALSLVNCPGAPRVKFLMGRPQPKAASPPNLVPEPFDSVTKILARFASVGFSPQEVVAILASHSVAGADNVDPTIPGTPFDSTPAVFDTNFFTDVLLKGTLFPGTKGNQGEVMSAIKGTLRLQSDNEIARDSRTACFWQDLVNNQASMASQFAAGVFKLSLLGQDANKLTDCSDVIPEPVTLKNFAATFPPGQTIADIQQSCDKAKFPNLPTAPGPPLDVPAIPQANGS